MNKLEFGTAGIRGKLGQDPDNLNYAHVQRIAHGYAKYLKDKYGDQDEIRVVIGRDNRRKSYGFSICFAKILDAHGIHVIYIRDIAPTPFVSYAIMYHKAHGGVNITASHNHKDYNGVKLFNELGSQYLPDEIEKIVEHFEPYENYDLKFEGAAKITKKMCNHLSFLSKKAIDSYQLKVSRVGGNFLVDNIKLAYTPLHGTGNKYMPDVLRKIGFEIDEKGSQTAFFVKEQMKQDPHFKHCATPNPELESAYKMLKKVGQKNDCDVIMLNDPDADRIGVGVRNEEGEYVLLDGNEIATLIFHYILETSTDEDIENTYMISSFVSSHLPKLLAKQKGVETIEVPTGFKWVAATINEIEGPEDFSEYEEVAEPEVEEAEADESEDYDYNELEETEEVEESEDAEETEVVEDAEDYDEEVEEVDEDESDDELEEDFEDEEDSEDYEDYEDESDDESEEDFEDEEESDDYEDSEDDSEDYEDESDDELEEDEESDDYDESDEDESEEDFEDYEDSDDYEEDESEDDEFEDEFGDDDLEEFDEEDEEDELDEEDDTYYLLKSEEVEEIDYNSTDSYDESHEKPKTLLFGFEESHGVLIDKRIAREKDGLQAVVILSKMASHYKKQGKTLLDVLEDIYEENGYVLTEHINVEINEKTPSLEEIQESFRELDLENKVLEDYNEKEGMLKADMLKIILEDSGSWLALRSSGTEPKIKFYITAHGETREEAEEILEELKTKIKEII